MSSLLGHVALAGPRVVEGNTSTTNQIDRIVVAASKYESVITVLLLQSHVAAASLRLLETTWAFLDVFDYHDT